MSTNELKPCPICEDTVTIISQEKAIQARVQQLEEALRKAREALKKLDHEAVFPLKCTPYFTNANIVEGIIRDALASIESLLNPDPLNSKGTK